MVGVRQRRLSVRRPVVPRRGVWPGPDGPVLFAATNNGLHRRQWRCHDDAGGEREYMELEFHPTNPDVCYTVQLWNQTTQFKRSTDGGLTFQSGAGLAVHRDGRRTTPLRNCRDPRRPRPRGRAGVGRDVGRGGLYGMYQSLDAGQTFEFNSCGDGPGGPWKPASTPTSWGGAKTARATADSTTTTSPWT